MDASGEEDESRVFILWAKELSPGGFCVSEDNRGEFAELVAGRSGRCGLGRRRRLGDLLYAIEHVEQGHGIDACEIADGEDQHETSQSQPSSDSGRPHTATVFDIVAFSLSFPAHQVGSFSMVLMNLSASAMDRFISRTS